MRRSKAPSMIKNSKRFCHESDDNKTNSAQSNGSEPENESYSWGTKDNPNATEREFISKNKRIFNIVWRDVSTKKFKTWKGDGTLELNLNSMKAIIKDDAGKYIGSSKKILLQDLQDDCQMVIGNKEIEVQNEIKDDEEIYELHKRQVENRNWGDEEYITPEMKAAEEKKPKGGFRFKPILNLRPLVAGPSIKNLSTPKINRENTSSDSQDQTSSKDSWANEMQASSTDMFPMNLKNCSPSNSHFKSKSLLCFIKPSDLQHFLFEQTRDFCIDHKNDDNNSLNVLGILRQVCNHPSLIKHSSSSNDLLLSQLVQYLPDWSEMGPFDSGKLEFVQYFLNNNMKPNQERKVSILARNTNALNMIQGLCDFMQIKCLRLNTTDPPNETKEEMLLKNKKVTEIKSSCLFLFDSIHLLNEAAVGDSLTEMQIIVFEDVSTFMKEIQELKQLNNSTVYYLVTSFSIEELLLLPSHRKSQRSDFNYEQLWNLVDADDSLCSVYANNIHGSCEDTLMGREDLDFFNSWHYLTKPFDDKFLKESDLENSSENLLSIFCKTDL